MIAVAAPPAVQRLWPESTIVCLGGGPSLTQADVDVCRERARVIAIKDAVRMAPWADVLYACDAKWWHHHRKTLTFEGPRYALEPTPHATTLQNTGFDGIETQPTGLRTGRNSGYQAINLAVHLGARRIVLLGYDMQRASNGEDHWFGAHPWRLRVPWEEFRPFFPRVIAPLQALGITVVNATRRTALDCFPQMPIEQALR